MEPRRPARPREDARFADMACAPYKFGWAFLLAWVFCVFYLGAADSSLSAEPAARAANPLLGGLPVFSSVATLAASILLEPRLGAPSSSKAVVCAAPVLAAVGTVMLLAAGASGAASCALFCLGAVLTGAGSGVMWILWGEYYASIPQDEREIAAPASAVIAALLALASSAMDGWVAAAFAASMPLISGACFVWAVREAEGGGEAAADAPHARELSALGSLASLGRTTPGIFMTCVFICLAGGFAHEVEPIATQAIMLMALVFTTTLAAAAIVGPRRISLAFFYRWMCPALVAGLGAVVLVGGEAGAFLSLAASIAARFAFCLITQLFFARCAETGRISATQAFGWGWIAVHLGDFVGVVILAMLAEPLAHGGVSAGQVAVASIVVLVVATMFVLDDARSFRAGTRGCDEEGHAPQTAPVAEPEGDAGRDEAAAVRTLDESIALVARNAGLTPRETEVFGLLARGRSIPYIRDELVISRETAATHAKHIYAKLDVHSRQELIDLVAKTS